MRAITLKPEFADAIARGEKHIENRSWGSRVRGPLAIHRGGPGGAIIAVCDVLDVVTPDEAARRIPTEASIAFGPLCWILGNVRPVGPFPCAGRLSLWPVLPEIESEISDGKGKAEVEEEGR